MPDTKLQPRNTNTNTNYKLKSSEQRFGHVNATNRNAYLNIIFIKLVTQHLKPKIRTFDVFRFKN